jgi:hypothetical protein
MKALRGVATNEATEVAETKRNRAIALVSVRTGEYSIECSVKSPFFRREYVCYDDHKHRAGNEIAASWDSKEAG